MIRTLEQDERRAFASKQRAAGTSARMAQLAHWQAYGLDAYPEKGPHAVEKSDLPRTRCNADQLGRGARDSARVPMGSERAERANGAHIHQAIRRTGHGPTRSEARRAGIL